MSPSPDEERRDLRARLRARRAALPPAERARESARISAHLLRHPSFPSLRRLGAYLADEGEPDLAEFFSAARRAGVLLHLPEPRGRVLRFLSWEPGAPLRTGRFGIPVPAEGHEAAAGTLDWVLVPLVAFGPSGERLGRGGGWYDRTFAGHARGGPPLLVGVAYAWQETAALPCAPWDVALDAVVTPAGWRTPGAGSPPGAGEPS